MCIEKQIMVTKSPVYTWLETFVRDKLWISEEAKQILILMETQSETQSSESHSDTESTTSESTEASKTSGKTFDFGPVGFVKKFNTSQLYLWARIRNKLLIREKGEPARKKSKSDLEAQAHDTQCIAVTVDNRKVLGAIDMLHDSKGYLRKYCTWENCMWVVDPFTQSILSTEYFHEALLCSAVSYFLADIPIFSRASLLCADLDKRQLHFSMVTDGKEMDHEVHSMDALSLQSVIFQVLVSLCIAQDRIKLKHHDLHLGNVMLTPRKEQGVWHAKTSVGTFIVPLLGYDATIIDYGLSSCVVNDVSIARLDADLMEWGNSGTSSESRASNIGKSWGVWDPDLDGDTGYDFAMFIESIVDTILEERPLPMSKLSLLSEIQAFAQTFCTDRNRPITKSSVDWKALFTKFLPQD